LEVFGFLAIFILAAAFTIIPKFKGRKLFSKKLAWESIILVALGNVLVLFTMNRFLPLDDILILGGVLIAFILVSDVLRKPSGPLALAEPFMRLSILSLLIATSLKTYFDLTLLNSSWESFPFLEIALISFPAMMIFGIEAKTLQFRSVRMKKKLVTLSFFSGAFATVLALLSALPMGSFADALFLVIASVLFFLTGVAFILGVSAFKNGVLKDNLKRMNQRDQTRYLYFSRAFRISSVWLVFALLLAVVYSVYSFDAQVPALFWIRDAFIHSMAIGFIASAIAAYSPILLPAVISGRAPYLGLTNLPLYLVTAGNIWRVGSDIVVSLNLPTSSLFTGYSGVLVIVGMLWFVMMNHRLK
ncbi:MAG: hypothetical protein ACRECH_00005, partial [Nitrososphaerales archaeon]